MTGSLLIDWAMMALSLFNTIMILWLSLTVLLNADRRSWGIWITAGGLLAGGLFFVSHSALLGLDLHYVSPGMDFWWRMGWPMVITLPFAWYMVTLWYTGFWEDRRSPLRHRQQGWMIGTSALFAGLIAMLVFANPLPTYRQAATLALGDPFAVSNVPLVFGVYAFYNVLCIALSLGALRNPAPSGRMMGDLARRRARPWLIAASVSFLLVSLLLALVMLWVVLSARERGFYDVIARTIGVFDVILSALIAGAVLLIGRALVSYEVFTGKTLPRQGLHRQWRNMVIVATGFGALAGGSLAAGVQPVYSVLLSTLLMTAFYALFNWRSYAEREQYMNQLRPFITSQGLYEQMLARTTNTSPDVDVALPFRALCTDLLTTRVAYLIPLGPMAPLAGPGLAYPSNATPPASATAEIAARLQSPQAMCQPIDPGAYGGATWAVPLWSERGLIGVLLLGDKRDGGLYAQEEIEIARASGERLLDTLAGAEMARRLMALQRQRLAENQVLDQRARRVLHDDVLPRLHAAMLGLNGPANGSTNDGGAVELLADAHRQISNLLHEIATTAAPEIAKSGLVGALHKVVETDLCDAFDSVSWDVSPELERELRQLQPLSAEVIFYAAREAMRNAARYGRGGDGGRPLHLRVSAARERALQLAIEDDGVGVRPEGRSDGGSGQGLALHSTMTAVIGGALSVESQPGGYTRVVLTLPREAWQESSRLLSNRTDSPT